MTVKEMTQGQGIEGIELLVERRSEATTKGGKPYLNLTLRDKTGSIQAKLWGYAEPKHGFFRENDVVKVWAEIEEYNGALQMNVKDVTLGTSPATAFARCTDFHVEEMWNSLVNIVGTFTEPLTKFVAEEVLLKHASVIEAIKKAPAAKGVHNAWYGGLLEHTWSMCCIAVPVIEHYRTMYCSRISHEKVLFGVLLHDVGKIIEYDYSKPSFEMTPVGVLVNHLIITPAWIYEAANRWTGQKDQAFKMERAHLMHLVAAHHGQPEWGSSVKPATVEAVLVHQLDMVDSKMMIAIDYATEGKAGPIAGFSERSYTEGTPFLQYK